MTTTATLVTVIGGFLSWAMTDWMWAIFVDGTEWVMLSNVIGMAVFANGGLTAMKPYASGGPTSTR